MNCNDAISKETEELNWADYFDSLVDQAWNDSRKHVSSSTPSLRLDSSRVQVCEAESVLRVRH